MKERDIVMYQNRDYHVRVKILKLFTYEGREYASIQPTEFLGMIREVPVEMLHPLDKVVNN